MFHELNGVQPTVRYRIGLGLLKSLSQHFISVLVGSYQRPYIQMISFPIKMSFERFASWSSCYIQINAGR